MTRLLPLLLLLSACAPSPVVLCMRSDFNELECVIEADPGRTVCFTIVVECTTDRYEINHCHEQDSEIDLIYFPLECTSVSWEIRLTVPLYSR